MKHEFLGFCQVCCRMQAVLAGRGVLAKHGYEIKTYGFQNGQCPGSFQLPYQQSCELVKADVVMLKDRIAGLERSVISVKAGSWPIYVSEYCSDKNSPFYRFVIRVAKNASDFDTESEADRKRGYYVSDLESDKRMFEARLYWQERRVRDWKLRPLIEAKIVEAAIAKRVGADKEARAKRKEELKAKRLAARIKREAKEKIFWDKFYSEEETNKRESQRADFEEKLQRALEQDKRERGQLT